MRKEVLNFRLSDDIVFYLRDLSKRTKRPMTFWVETALLDFKIKDGRSMKKEIELKERDCCYHDVPQDGKHYCNICSKLGF